MERTRHFRGGGYTKNSILQHLWPNFESANKTYFGSTANEHMMKTNYVTFTLYIVLFAIVFLAQSVQAQSTNVSRSCEPIDLVILIDQSDSMAQSDRNNYRIDAVHALIDKLFYHSALGCRNIEHQIAVIGFGRDTNFLVPLQRIQLSATDANWIQASEQIKSQIVVQSLGYTTVDLAFNDAIEILQQTPAISAEAPRKQSIILITDGEPCRDMTPLDLCRQVGYINHYFYANQNVPHSNFYAYPEGFVAALDRLIPPPTSPQIDVLMFQQFYPQSDTEQAWTEITNKRGGQFYPPEEFSQNLAQISQTTDAIVAQLLGIDVNTVVCNEPFIVEPYSANLIISSIRPDPDIRIQVVAPRESIISSNENNYIDLSTVERYIIARPEPGPWRIQGNNCEAVQATYELITVDAELQSAPEQIQANAITPYTVNNPDNYVTLQLLENGITPFSILDDYPLSICGRITPVTATDMIGGDTCLDFETTNLELGLYRSMIPLPAPAQGTYNLNITGTFQSLGYEQTGDNITLFELQHNYQTIPPQDIELVLIQPEETPTIPIVPFETEQDLLQTVTVAARLQSTNGSSIDVTDVWRANQDLSEIVLAQLLGSQGEIIETFPLISNDEQIFTADVNFEQTLPTGEYAIRIAVSETGLSSYDSGKYQITTTSAQIPVERCECPGILFNMQSVNDEPYVSGVKPQVVVYNEPMSALTQSPAPFEFTFSILDINLQPISLRSVLLADTPDTDFLQVFVSGTNLENTPLSFEETSTDDGQVYYKVEVPTSVIADNTGEYVLSLAYNNAVLQPDVRNYSSQTATYSINRALGIYNPVVLRSIAFTLITIMLLYFLNVLRIRTDGLRGTLNIELIDHTGDNWTAEPRRTRFRLGGIRWIQLNTGQHINIAFKASDGRSFQLKLYVKSHKEQQNGTTLRGIIIDHITWTHKSGEQEAPDGNIVLIHKIKPDNSITRKSQTIKFTYRS